MCAVRSSSVGSGGRDLGPLVGAIDQGTSSTRFLVFSASTAELVTYHQVSVSSHHPRPGWVEQDPEELLQSVKTCIDATVENLKRLDGEENFNRSYCRLRKRILFVSS